MKPERRVISILVVEDDKTTSEMLRVIINRKFPGIPLYFAENGRRGVELFKANAPEIVITDMVMPEMDGVEMSSIIKTIKSDIKLIVVTGYGATSSLEKFSEIGANALLTKPIDFKKLFDAIESCIDEIR